MSFTDYSLDGYVYPQDGASTGISDSDASWVNAAYVGALSLARTSDYSPKGLSITADHTNENFDLSEGLAYIEDAENIGFREFSDNEQTRSGNWTQNYLAVLQVEAEADISFETTSGVNHVYLYFTRTAQNDIKLRVADTTADKPSNRALKLGEIDASADTSTEKNRNAGLDWQFVNAHETNGLVNEADIPVNDGSYDEYMLKFTGVRGDYTSTDGQLHGTVNNVTSSSYDFRTTQNNTRDKTFFKIIESRPTDSELGGHLLMTQHNGVWEFKNNVTGNIGKQTAFSGRCTDSAATPISSMQISWNNGQIEGRWTVWGRNTL